MAKINKSLLNNKRRAAIAAARRYLHNQGLYPGGTQGDVARRLLAHVGLPITSPCKRLTTMYIDGSRPDVFPTREQSDYKKSTIKFSREYYSTPLWARIRELVYLEKGVECWICGERSDVIHHQSYDDATMRGDDRSNLFPLCHQCHRDVHFSGNKKRSTIAAFDVFNRMVEGNSNIWDS